jgi:hypothetical protein
MVKVTDQNYYMDGYLKTNLDTAKKIAAKDWDMVFLVDGSEGSGKSILTQQVCYYLTPTFNITFKPEEFEQAIDEAERFTGVIYDEAMTGLSSRAAMTRINRALVNKLAEIRQKNLFVFIVLPTFFDLDKYVALWRSRALLHVYTGENFERGYFAFYNIDRKKDLYINGKKFYSYHKPRPNFTGRFTNHYCVDEQEYRREKLKSLYNREESANTAYEERYKQRFLALVEILQELGHTQQDIADLLTNHGCNITRTAINKLLGGSVRQKPAYKLSEK